MLGYNKLLTETCSYEKYKSVNDYNEKSYDTAKEIECFTSFNFMNNMGMEQQELTTTKKVFIKSDITPQTVDKIDGLEIKAIAPVKGLLTETIGWEITL